MLVVTSMISSCVQRGIGCVWEAVEMKRTSLMSHDGGKGVVKRILAMPRRWRNTVQGTSRSESECEIENESEAGYNSHRTAGIAYHQLAPEDADGGGNPPPPPPPPYPAPPKPPLL